MQFRNGVLERLEITDGLGQVTEVGFQDLKALDEVDEARFRFQTPAGVDEILDD